MSWDMKQKNVVILNGTATVGKNEFVKQLSELVKVKHISSIEKYKNILKEFFKPEYDETCKDDSVRKFLSDFKALAVKHFNDSYHEMMQKIFEFFESDDDVNILFIDIREPEEIQKIMDQFHNDEITTVLITNPNKECNMSNDSDANVFDFTYDWIIENDGTIEDLKEKAKIFYEGLLPHFVLTPAKGDEQDVTNLQ